MTQINKLVSSIFYYTFIFFFASYSISGCKKKNNAETVVVKEESKLFGTWVCSGYRSGEYQAVFDSVRIWNGSDSVTTYLTTARDTTFFMDSITIDVLSKDKWKITVTNLVRGSVATICDCFPGGVTVPELDTLYYSGTDTLQHVDKYRLECLGWHTGLGVYVALEYYYLEGRIHLMYEAYGGGFGPGRHVDEIDLDGRK